MRTKLEAGRTLCGVEVSDLVRAPPNLHGAVTNNLFCFRQCGVIIRQYASHSSRGVAFFVEDIETIGEQSATLRQSTSSNAINTIERVTTKLTR